MSNFYLDNGNGKAVITILINHDGPSVLPLFLNGSIRLENTQVLPLSSATSETSYLDLRPDPNDAFAHYVATSGTCTITNLSVHTIGNSSSGVVGFDMELDGLFDISTSEEVEQKHITGTIHFAPFPN